MNAIIRDIAVTRKNIVEKIEVTKGTDMIPIVFRIIDFVIPATAVATAYVKSKNRTMPQKKLCAIAGDKVTLEPTNTLFATGENILQIRLVDANKTIVTFEIPVKCEKVMEFGDFAEEQQQTLVQQILAKYGELTTLVNKIKPHAYAGLANVLTETNPEVALAAPMAGELDKKIKANADEIKKIKPHAFVDPVNNLTGTDPKIPLASTAVSALQRKITCGVAEPTGGQDGDVYIQFES